METLMGLFSFKNYSRHPRPKIGGRLRLKLIKIRGPHWKNAPVGREPNFFITDGIQYNCTWGCCAQNDSSTSFSNVGLIGWSPGCSNWWLSAFIKLYRWHRSLYCFSVSESLSSQTPSRRLSAAVSYKHWAPSSRRSRASLTY